MHSWCFWRMPECYAEKFSGFRAELDFRRIGGCVMKDKIIERLHGAVFSANLIKSPSVFSDGSPVFWFEEPSGKVQAASSQADIHQIFYGRQTELKKQ